MSILKKIAAGLLTTVITASMASGAFAEGISVTVNNFRSPGIQFINFSGNVQPITIDNRLLVPARALGEAAGMDIQWDQNNATAILTLNAASDSYEPIEQYAADLINKVGGYGMSLTPVNITVAFQVDSAEAVVRYNFIDVDGETVSVGKTITMSSLAIMSDEHAVMIPVRGFTDSFCLDVNWNQDTQTADISVPDVIKTPTGLSIIASHDTYTAQENSTTSVDVGENDPVDTSANLGTYIGRFKITHYCTCNICNGGWGNNTAWAGQIIPGQTIAVDPNIIGKLRWVYIEDYGLRRAEDCGGAIQGYHIDMAVSSHEEAYRLGVVYKDVYYAD